MQVLVSIIIVNFNCGKYIINCLKSIYDHSKGIDFEIILIDNGSVDNSLPEIRKKFPEIRIITNPHNIGFGAANNIGAKHAAGEYLFLLNPDTLLLNDCLSFFIRFLSAARNNVVSCGGRLETASGAYSVSFGNFPSLFQQFSDIGFKIFYKKFYIKHLSISPPCHFDTPQEVGYLSGANIFIKKDIFLKMNGFDERFFMYFEDTDLFFRLRNEGYKAYLLPAVKIVHYGDSALLPNGSFNYAKYAMAEKSKYLYFAKNIGSASVFLIKIFQVVSLVIHYFGRYRYNLCKMVRITLKPSPATIMSSLRDCQK